MKKMNEYNEIDKRTGKRYKTVGNTRIFEPEYNLSYGIDIPKSQIKQFNSAIEKAKKESEEKKHEAEYICPINNMGRAKCKKKCVYYSSEGCFKQLKKSSDKYCPFISQTCKMSHCRMFNKGYCSILQLIHNLI